MEQTMTNANMLIDAARRRWDLGKKLPLRPGTRAVGGVTAAGRAQNNVEPHSGDPGVGDATRDGTCCARARGENSLGPAAQEPEETTTTPRCLAADQHLPRETGSSSDDYRLTSSPRRLAADQHVPRETGSSSDDDRLFAAQRAAASSPRKSQVAGERKGGGDDSNVDDDYGLLRTNTIRGRVSSSSAQLPAWPPARAEKEVIVDRHAKRGSKHTRPGHPSSALRGGPLATGPQKSISVAASSSDASAEKLVLSNGVRGRLMGVAAAYFSEGPRAGSGLKVPRCGRDQNLGNASSDDDDIGTLIDKDLNKRIAAIAAGSGSFRGANPSHRDPNGHGRDEEAYDTGEAPSSDSGSGRDDLHRILRGAEGPKGRDSALSSSLQKLLTKIETSATNVGGFNDILKDAIYDKLRKSSNVARAQCGSSVEKVVLSNGVPRPLMGVPSAYFSEGPSTSPSRQHTASPPRTSLFSPENYIPKSSPGDSSPPRRKSPSYTNKRDFFEGSYSLSQNDLADWQFNQAIKKRSLKHRRESLRLNNYFESRSQQRDRLFFLATWQEWVVLCVMLPRRRANLADVALRRMQRSELSKAFRTWESVWMSLQSLVNRGHNVSIRIGIRVLRDCFYSWRETRMTEPVEKLLFMEPICYVTRMLRIARQVNAHYECHLCFLGWRNKMHQTQLHSHMGHFVILRRLRAMLSWAFQTLRIFARKRTVLMALGFKIGTNKHGTLQRSVFVGIQELILMRKTLSTAGRKLAAWCARSCITQAFAGWLAAVLSHITYSQGRIRFIVAQRTDRGTKIAFLSAWRVIAQIQSGTNRRGLRALRRIGRRWLAISLQRWRIFISCSRELSWKERHLLSMFSAGSIRSRFQKWTAMYLHSKTIARILCGFKTPGMQCITKSMKVWKMYAAHRRIISRGKRRALSQYCRMLQHHAFRAWYEVMRDRNRLMRVRKKIEFLLHGSLRLYFQGWVRQYVYSKKIARILMNVEGTPNKLLAYSFQEWEIYRAKQSIIYRGNRRGLSRFTFRTCKLYMEIWLNVLKKKRQLVRAKDRIILKIAIGFPRTWFQAWAGEAGRIRQVEHTRQVAVKRVAVKTKGMILNAWKTYTSFKARLMITARRLFHSQNIKNRRLVVSMWYEICIRKRRAIQQLSSRKSFQTVKRACAAWQIFTIVRKRQKSVGQRIQHKLHGRRLWVKKLAMSIWSDALLANRRYKAVIQRVVTRIQHATLASGLLRWQEHVLGLRRQQGILEKVASRMRVAVVYKAYTRWEESAKKMRRVERGLHALKVRRDHRSLRTQFLAVVELSQRLSTVRRCTVFGHLQSCDKMVAKQSFATWSSAVVTKQVTRAKHNHILRRLRRRLNFGLLQASWEAWLKGVLCKYSSLKHAVHDWGLLSLLDEYGTSLDEVLSIRNALNQNQKLENVARLLQDAKERARVIVPSFHRWRRNIGTWMPRATLGNALVSKALMALAPNPPTLGVSNSAACEILATGLDDTSTLSIVQHLIHSSKDPAIVYAMLRTIKDVMDRWKWLVRWGRTKRLISRRFSKCKIEMCLKMWCLAVSKSLLLRQAELKLVSWTSVRGKGKCFRAWAIRCRESVHNQIKVAGSDDRRNRLMMQNGLCHWADLTFSATETKLHETAEDFANATLQLVADIAQSCPDRFRPVQVAVAHKKSDIAIAAHLQIKNTCDFLPSSDREGMEKGHANQEMEKGHADQESADAWLDRSAPHDNLMPCPKGCGILSVGSEDDSDPVQAQRGTTDAMAPVPAHEETNSVELHSFDTLETLKTGLADVRRSARFVTQLDAFAAHHGGLVDAAHFCEAIALLGLGLSLQQVQALFATLDVFGDGVLHKEEIIMVLDLDQAISPLAAFGDEHCVVCTTEQDDKGTKEEDLQKTEHEVAAKTQGRKEARLCEG